ncbi:response regulator transcription factor [Phyllobacterium myrsinacearum]|uniref:DNA-binding response regulator n=1 Tax=Phyllobacterium myrsinacearum TaxID=28101 RepID=A0A2S9JQV1_9HYPH|nr:response regulator transcription factor [Phyllobacterium myrsinacearum]PRD55561.1 DNA-binding response regulator [Phyllobacterium myrsinacearum]RZV05983.1 DNA-binding response OmpR family regulator [Phyllobacterium myrsinacearum]
MRILLVEDEEAMALALMKMFAQQGCIMDHVTTIAMGEEALRSNVHDVVLLDRNLPDGDGVTLLRSMRNIGVTTPVIVLSAFNGPLDRITGLDYGADDYIGKPFLSEELMARIRAAIRRSNFYSSNVISAGNVKLDLGNLDVIIDGRVMPFPRRETLVLKSLLARAGKTVLRQTIEEAVYGYGDEIQSNSLDSHVSRLRKRLMASKANIQIHGIRGIGYLLKEAT